jgi:hypothetical protein
MLFLGLTTWTSFGRPSDFVIGNAGHVAHSCRQSTDKTNPRFQQGIRIGSVKD